ncbi:MAG: ribosomal L7Ae/L30e/S12e/Gadd45 family protein [Firmicutes bacterium]|nr:ribosomal L7Ae/L30e/S12e/Gadd45 family protein [Bacillota bacterium]
MDLSSLSSAKKHVGVKQTIRALESNSARLVYVAGDADRQLIAEVLALCIVKDVEIVNVPTRAELGDACGIDVGAAVVALLK